MNVETAINPLSYVHLEDVRGANVQIGVFQLRLGVSN